jgi:polyisoprenoid-binding protein YceI
MLSHLLAAVLSLGLVASAPLARAAEYKIDPSHTQVVFMIDHLGYSKTIGAFSDTRGTIGFDLANPTQSKLSITIKTASLQTLFGPRDVELEGGDWFNVAEFPEINFVGTAYAKRDDKSGTVTGNLTLLGVTKPVTLDVTLNKAAQNPMSKADTVGFSARGSLKRTDFGLTNFLASVGDKVDLIIETEATR